VFRRNRVRILFSGYAPVHFLCFRPIYERLRRAPGLDFFFSGDRVVDRNGARRKDVYALYRPFRVPRERVLPLARMERMKFDLAFSSHTSGFFPRHPCPKVQIFHGISYRNVAVREAQRKYDALFVVGPYQMRALRSLGIVGRGGPEGIPIGFPKLDRFFDGSLSREKILRRAGLRGDRPVVLFAPTGAKHNSLETMGEKVIDRIRRDGRLDLVIKLHDHARKRIDWTRRLRRFEGRSVKIVRDLDVVPWLYAADLLMSDASSVANEYALLDRPIVFLDVPRLIARSVKKGMLDLKTHGRKVGFTVRRPKDVVRVIHDCLAHPRRRSASRRAAARDLFYNPGHAAEAAAQWLLKRFRLPQAVA
jgi:hypothetical protein